MAEQKSFKVIIVGGGPAGLTLAQCLSAANIDYILFERRPQIIEQSGSGLGINPDNARVFDQLNLLTKAKALSCPTGDMVQITPGGRVAATLSIFQMLEKNLGFPYIMLSRTQVCQLLYENLPEKEKDRIRVGKRVASVEQNAKCAKVIFEDGAAEEGDIVVSCDGIYSTARKAVDAKPLNPIQAEYRCLYGTSTPLPPTKKSGEFHVSLGQGVSAQCFTVNDRADWILYEKLPTAMSGRVSYTKEEEHAFAEKYFDKAIDDNGTTFGELWQRCTRYQATILEEGVFTKWHQGRVVLLGDAAHKTTPNLAQGYNTSAQDAVALTNQLHSLVNTGNSKDIPLAEIEKAFAKYQAQRYDIAKENVRASGANTRMCSWDSVALKWMPRIMPRAVILNMICNRTKAGLALTCKEYPQHSGLRFDDEAELSKSSVPSITKSSLVVVIVIAVLAVTCWLSTGSMSSH